MAALAPPVTEESVRDVLTTLAATYHGRGSVELGDPFKVLVATVISARTREEQTTTVSNRVFARYPDAPALAAADEGELYDLLEGSQYREAKAPRLIAMATILVEKYEGTGSTHTAVRVLDRAGRVTELSRMLAGMEGSGLARAHAEELLAAAAAAKAARPGSPAGRDSAPPGPPGNGQLPLAGIRKPA